MKDLTLVILAAGMGSRYGGLKQIDEFGLNGEAIIDFSIYDAIEAGFNKLVLIIREEHEEVFEDVLVGKLRPFIDVEYSRPSMKGREIFGSLVPYGIVWRTGANSATKVTFGEDVSIGGTPLKAGAYSLYTIPGERVWTIILNSNTGNWGTSGFDKKDDVAEFKVPVQVTTGKTETFTISIDNIKSNSCELAINWGTTRVPIMINVDNDPRIMAWLDKELKGDKPPYQQAASYYLDNGKDMKLALDYANSAIKENPKAFYLHWLKARVLDKMGNKKEALKEAKIAADAAANTPYAIEYQNNYDSLK